MDIQSLKTFIKTAELLHFGKASRACNLSPSALTRTIQRLEEEIGQPLFLRDNRTVSLTPAGNKLLLYAQSTVQEWRQLCDSIVAEPSISGTLSIYASVTAIYSLLPNLLETYRSTYPAVHLELRSGVAETAVEQVLSGGIDLAVAALPDRIPNSIDFLPLIKTPLVFIASSSAVSIDPTQDPLVLPATGVARQRLDRYLRQHHLSPNLSVEVSGNEALIALVRLGSGIGLVPQLALERSPFRNEIQILKTAPKLAPYVVGLCANKRTLKHPAAHAMWKIAADLSHIS